MRWPIWLILLLLRPFALFQYIFLVYPGEEKHLEIYCPQWLKRSHLLDSKPSVIGFIAKTKGSRGLVIGVPSLIGEFKTSKGLTEKLIKNTYLIKKLIGASDVAMAGQIPSVINEHKISLPDGFVDGAMGTVFCVEETIKEVVNKHDISKVNAKISVIGVGHVGGLLIKSLKDDGFQVTGIDIKKTSSGVVLASASENVLRESDMVVILTPRGQDFLPYAGSLGKSTIVIDDTHPKIRINELRIDNIFYKVAIGLGALRFFPKLPGYKQDWIPGCVLEAMHNSITKSKTTSQIVFNQEAKIIGFYAHLTK